MHGRVKGFENGLETTIYKFYSHSWLRFHLVSLLSQSWTNKVLKSLGHNNFFLYTVLYSMCVKSQRISENEFLYCIKFLDIIPNVQYKLLFERDTLYMVEIWRI